jgi:hypothetical protein
MRGSVSRETVCEERLVFHRTMNKPRVYIVALAGLLLQACVQMPQTAAEFRKAVADRAMMTKTDTYRVNRPLSDVASNFERLAPKCLDVRVQTVSHTTTSFQNLIARYKATVVRTNQRTELHVQQLYETGVLYPSKPPESGVYLLVADADSESNQSTRIQLYGPSMGYEALYRAIRGWASGESLDCPDMTKVP